METSQNQGDAVSSWSESGICNQLEKIDNIPILVVIKTKASLFRKITYSTLQSRSQIHGWYNHKVVVDMEQCISISVDCILNGHISNDFLLSFAILIIDNCNKNTAMIYFVSCCSPIK